MRINSCWMGRLLGGLLLAGLVAWGAVQFRPAQAREARGAKTGSPPAPTILESIGARSGLCVHLGFQDADLTTALAGDGRYLVHGLSPEGKVVAEVRKAIRAAGLQGTVSVEEGPLERLPYADDLVNAVVVENFQALAAEGLSLDEVLRVVTPDGTVFLQVGGDASSARKTLAPLLKKAGIDSVEMLAEGGSAWAKLRKPRPEGMDVWSHRRYDAGGTSVSREKHVGVPSGLRWVAGPTWATGLRYSAVQAVTVDRRHLVYFFDDEVPTSEGPRQQSTLVSRDAYNGLLLWKRPVEKARAPLLVTVGNRAYTILGDDEPLVALDTATGETVKTYEEAGRPSEILVHDGRLVVDCGSGEVRCLDAETGKLHWTNEDAGENLLAGDGQVFFRTSARKPDGKKVEMVGSLDLKTGKQRWRASTHEFAPSLRDLVFYADGVIVIGGGKGTHAVSAEDGSHLWSYEYPLIGHGGSYSKVLYQKGLVWVHPAESEGKKQYAWEGLDPQTGEIKQRFKQPGDFRMKHRCFSDRGTAEQIL